MEKLIRHLEEMKKWMGRVMVSEDNVDYMAMARQEYRNAMDEIERIKKENKEWLTEPPASSLP